jgi:phospholipid/cholesterol/gamma-HCH transport system permease protein
MSQDETAAAAPPTKPSPPVAALLGGLGRAATDPLRRTLEHTSGIVHLFFRTLEQTFVAPFAGRNKLKAQLFPMMSNVGVRSLPIVILVSFLIGAILVLQTGEVLKRYGQLQEVPGLVALSMTRELGPLMTAIVLTARVGASFTAVLASMKINEEILALESMAIDPVGYLVSPRFLGMIVMVPCLTVLAFLVGMAGGYLVAGSVYGIPGSVYIAKTFSYLSMSDIFSGLAKSVVFGVLITLICCYYGLISEGGPMGLGRNIMVAVVSSLVMVVLADMLLTALFVNYVF